MKLREDDIPEVREESFATRPETADKRSAIVSLADTVESASRSLEKTNSAENRIARERLIEERISDRQLDDCDLTLGEMKVIAIVFDHALMMCTAGSLIHSTAPKRMSCHAMKLCAQT